MLKLEGLVSGPPHHGGEVEGALLNSNRVLSRVLDASSFFYTFDSHARARTSNSHTKNSKMSRVWVEQATHFVLSYHHMSLTRIAVKKRPFHGVVRG